jgi:hypothetical protein
VENWEICNQLGGAVLNSIASNPINETMRLIPWGGVAFCTHKSLPGADGINYRTCGVAYCFLPLPVRTGLPVMVNGFFELSSNRRDVWQSGEDMTGDGKTRAQWNLSLMVKKPKKYLFVANFSVLERSCFSVICKVAFTAKRQNGLHRYFSKLLA